MRRTKTRSTRGGPGARARRCQPGLGKLDADRQRLLDPGTRLAKPARPRGLRPPGLAPTVAKNRAGRSLGKRLWRGEAPLARLPPVRKRPPRHPATPTGWALPRKRPPPSKLGAAPHRSGGPCGSAFRRCPWCATSCAKSPLPPARRCLLRDPRRAPPPKGAGVIDLAQ